MRILFMGTPDIAAECLKALYAAGHEICGVFTQPDKPKNRGHKLTFSPVKEYALSQNLPVYQPLKLRDGTALALVQELHPECRRYWETYDKYGLWKDHTLMAHCVHSDEVERKAIRDANAVVVHCGDSNVNICSGVCPVRRMLDEGIWVTLGSDIAGGAQLPMYKVIATSIRTSKVRRITDDWHTDFLTVGEGYYLGTTSGHKYFGAGEGFAVGDKLHAIVVDDSDFPEASHSLSVEERFERIIYMTHRHNIVSVWSDGREVVKR